MYYTYVLRSKVSRRLYAGHTENLSRRLLEHNTNRSPATRNKGPFELVHSERYKTKAEAYRRELYFKIGKGREELKKFLGP